MTVVMAATLLGASCVHTDYERTGRSRLVNGREGTVPVFASTPAGYDEVAVVSIHADSFATAERLERHLLRRASLMGCAAVTDVYVQAEAGAQAVCVTPREPTAPPPEAVAIVDPSPALVARVEQAGAQGQALLRVFAQVMSRPAGERAWPLRWYQKNYPNSPFANEVEALFVYGVAPGTVAPSASVRMAPTAP
jgi:hypothetical protein